MNILSLFDGMSCGQIALERADIEVTNYYASEIKKYAIDVTQDNYPDTIQLGDVTKIDLTKFPKIDLLIGGSPCQDMSIAMKNREGLAGEKSKLFWEYVRVLKEVKPKYFFLENVAKANKDDIAVITETLGVEPIRINSKLVSAQLRDRLYWTNIPNLTQPKDKGILLQDIITSGYVDKLKSRALVVSESRPLTSRDRMIHRYKTTGMLTLVFEDINDKENTCRIFNQTELERLQTVPAGYTKILTRNKAADVLGDGWTVDVIAHIFKGLKIKEE